MWRLVITILIVLIAMQTCFISDSLHRMEGWMDPANRVEQLNKQLEGLTK